MGESPLAAMGMVVQWTSSLLLLLLFLRLRRSGAGGEAAAAWAAAWGAQLLSITGDGVRSVDTLLGRPLDGTAYDLLHALSIPGALTFVVLAAVAGLRSGGRSVGTPLVRRGVLAATAAGFAVAAVNNPTATGTVLVTAIVALFLGVAISIGRAERARRRHAFPLVAIAMFLYGAVSGTYQVGASFGSIVWPVDDFSGMIGWSAGYGVALVALLLGGAALAGMIEDAVRPPVVVENPPEIAVQAPRAAAEFAPSPVPVVAEVGLAEPTPSPASSSRRSSSTPIPPARRAPRAGARTATLPLPPVHANGRLAEALVIDDEAAVRALLTRIFQRGGWPVRDVSTGEEALAWLLDVSADDAPTVILCDFKMPGMGGQQLHTHLVRERPEFALRMVFVTGDTTSESARKFIAGTSCQVVEKPFTVTDIARAVEEVLAATILGRG